jgi:hypothetical protein
MGRVDYCQRALHGRYLRIAVTAGQKRSPKPLALSVSCFRHDRVLSCFRSGCCAANRQGDNWKAGLKPAVPPQRWQRLSLDGTHRVETREGPETVGNDSSEARKPALTNCSSTDRGGRSGLRPGPVSAARCSSIATVQSLTRTGHGRARRNARGCFETAEMASACRSHSTIVPNFSGSILSSFGVGIGCSSGTTARSQIRGATSPPKSVAIRWSWCAILKEDSAPSTTLAVTAAAACAQPTKATRCASSVLITSGVTAPMVGCSSPARWPTASTRRSLARRRSPARP